MILYLRQMRKVDYIRLPTPNPHPHPPPRADTKYYIVFTYLLIYCILYCTIRIYCILYCLSHRTRYVHAVERLTSVNSMWFPD